MQTRMLLIFILIRNCFIVDAMLPFAQLIIRDGAKLELIVDASWIMALGIVFDIARAPIKAGEINQFASNKSMPVINIFPHWLIVFHIPDFSNSLTASILKNLADSRISGNSLY